MAEKLGLKDILQKLRNSTDTQDVSVGNVVSAFEQKGFGPLLMVPALITLLPTGAIPGVPAVCGILIIFIAAQILMGAKHPWLPAKLRRMSIRRDSLNRAVDKAIPYAEKIDKFIKPRWELMSGPIAMRIIAALSILLALSMIFLGFIPFAVAVPSAALTLMGLALSSEDGLLMGLAIGLAVITGWLVLQGVGYS